MKEEKSIRYEKPALSMYDFLGVVKGDEWEGGLSGGGDIPDICDSDFDE